MINCNINRFVFLSLLLLTTLLPSFSNIIGNFNMPFNGNCSVWEYIISKASYSVPYLIFHQNQAVI